MDLNIIEKHLEKILSVYTTGKYYEDLKAALKIYIDLTGQMNEDSNDYEIRMNNFNDWFIFNYRLADDMKVIDRYIHDENIEESLAKSFHNINYSVFHFAKINFRKKIIVKDILHNEKLVLSEENGAFGLIEDDLFIGRAVELEGQTYLLKGMCILPRNVLGNVKKEAKRVRKLTSDNEEEKFLLKLEALKTKSLNYTHVDPNQIFKFN